MAGASMTASTATTGPLPSKGRINNDDSDSLDVRNDKPLDETLDVDEVSSTKPNTLAALGPLRKNVLLVCFCLSIFIDSAGVSAAFLTTAPISAELGISPSNEAWVTTSYSLAFAATLLLAGRLAEMFSPKLVYTIGYAGMGGMYLVISFMDNQYAFFIIRAISALIAVLTIPSSVNMIIQMYPDAKQQARKLALFGVAGGLASTIAPILIGLFLLVSWRWYFGFITCIALPFSCLAIVLLPRTEKVAKLHGTDKWKQLDLGGVFLLMTALILFILAFTQGGIFGWASAAFLAPFLISVIVLFPGFVIWEETFAGLNALLPQGVWSFPNMLPLIVQATTAGTWFASYQLRCAVYWQSALGNSPILTAAKLIPMGAVALVAGLLTHPFPKLITHPRFVQPGCSILEAVGAFLLAFSGGGWGTDYWKWIFPGELVGTFGGMLSFVSFNTLIIMSFPREYAGVAASFSNVIVQTATTAGIAIQAGLVSTGKGGSDWTGDRNGYIFLGSYVLVCGSVFMVAWKQPKDKEQVTPATDTPTTE